MRSTSPQASDANLDLSSGSFTLSAWVKPAAPLEANCIEEYWDWNPYCTRYEPQGILGFDSGRAGAYPALQHVATRPGSASGIPAVQHRIRFGFASSSGWIGYWESGSVLTEDAWNHVVVTFTDGRMKLYVNGAEAGHDDVTFAGVTPAATNNLEIGRSSRTGTLQLANMLARGEFSDINWRLCVAVNGAEMFNTRVSGSNDPDDDGYIDPYPFSVGSIDFTESAELKLWADYMGPTCGSAPNSTDDRLLTQTYTTDGPNTSHPIDSPYNIGDTRVYFNGSEILLEEGYFDRIYLNDSAPFQGALDDVRIYREALDPVVVQDLFSAGTTALHLRLDDPPGETSFKDVIGQHNGTCSGTTCPTVGVAGRVPARPCSSAPTSRTASRSVISGISGRRPCRPGSIVRRALRHARRSSPIRRTRPAASCWRSTTTARASIRSSMPAWKTRSRSRGRRPSKPWRCRSTPGCTWPASSMGRSSISTGTGKRLP